MSKFFGFDENMSNAIAKITTPKLALMSGLVAPEKEFITGSGSSITIKAGILIAVGDSVFKTTQTTLTASNLDSGNSFTVGKDYCIYICDPTGGDDTDFTGEVYLISLNTTYPAGYTASTSRKIGGFHYGKVRGVNDKWNPVNSSGTEKGSGWESNVSNGIIPNSVWTLEHRPTCDPTGMVYIGPFWADIYASSDDGAQGLQSKYGVVPITGTEGLNWYIANERAMRVGKRMPSYAEWCKCAHGSPQGLDANNNNAWSATTNSARTTCGNVNNAVSAKNCRDCVGNVWEWVDDLLHDPTAATAGWYDPMEGQGFGQIYTYSATALHALGCGGAWDGGVRAGSRAVSCAAYPWSVDTHVGVRCVCDAL